MKKTIAPKPTPSPASSAKTQSIEGGNTALVMFAGAVLDVSWQMIVVVLVPIIGGYELDKHFGTTPVLTIIGFVLAMLGTFVVIKKVFVEYGDRTVRPGARK
jgi:F0F1-type ATP synthase assembly protein I